MFKKIKSAFDLLSLYFILIIFCGLMVVSALSINKLIHNESIAQIPVQIIIAILSGTLGGAFTLVGVDKTFKEQKKETFINEFPSKILNLDTLLEKIDLLKLKLYKENGSFLILEENKIQDMFNLSTEIDGYIYFKLREAHLKFSAIIHEIFYSDAKIFTQNEYGERKLIENNENKLTNKLIELNGIVDEIDNISKQYRDEFISFYNKNIDGLIYKKING